MHKTNNACEEFIEDFITRLKQYGFADYWSVKGCRLSSVSIIEESFGYRLPEMYRQFLLKMGRGAGKFFQGTALFWNESLFGVKNLRGFQEAFLYTLEEDKFDFELTDNCFSFAHHQGYIHWYFYVNEGEEDPPVYIYQSEYLFTEKASDSFSQFLTECLEEQSKFIHLL